MSRTNRTRRPIHAAAVVGALALVGSLAGCGASQNSQTATQVAAVEGANVGSGSVQIRNAMIAYGDDADGAVVYGAGDDAALMMTIINVGNEPDRLIGAASPAASAVEFTGDGLIPGTQTLVATGELPESAAPTAAAPTPTGAVPTDAAPTDAAPTGTAPTDTTPTGTAPGSASATTAAPRPEVAVPTDVLGQRTTEMTLVGLTSDITSGLTYPLVLRFERAGDITVPLPIARPDVPREPVDESSE